MYTTVTVNAVRRVSVSEAEARPVPVGKPSAQIFAAVRLITYAGVSNFVDNLCLTFKEQ